jgi:plastocyanin
LILDFGSRILDLREFVLLSLLTCSIACDATESHKESPAAPPQVQTGTGIIRGEVKFEGKPPKMGVIKNEPCHEDAGPIEEETVIVNGNGTLRNVLVSVEGAGHGDGASREPALLDQKDCRYVPHVLGVQVGQALRLRSSDPTMHNVHYVPDANPQGNYGFTKAGDERTVKFAGPEVVRMKCDVHPWMTAYVGVFENPFFAVTGEDGSFEIKGLAAGEYKLVAWHERYGRLEQLLTVNEAAPAETSFAYKAPL